ncbi:hypothetical protein GCM10010440_76290 [Kitasatospora cinereorecta]|uniref:Uncharacterized protein n=1 Tax=Kitasatospora paracochleata TaxID=58354 RepID=A0ABT1IWA8_9ACTN|nr:hypothetical protein [Kitasatospora paracochleata]
MARHKSHLCKQAGRTLRWALASPRRTIGLITVIAVVFGGLYFVQPRMAEWNVTVSNTVIVAMRGDIK